MPLRASKKPGGSSESLSFLPVLEHAHPREQSTAAKMPPKAGMSAKRIAKELIEVNKELPDGIRAGLKNQDNLFEWYAQIDGPTDSVYEGGVFDIDISVPSDYPFKPPRAQFRTKVYHMNINAQGGICLDILKTAWSPALSILKVILSILSLLTDPNPNDPLVGDIARQYMTQRAAHDAKAKSYTAEHAKPEFAVPPVKKAIPAPAPAPALAPAPKASASTSSATSTAASTSATGRANGKAREKEGSSAPITIDDSDDDDVVPERTQKAGSKKRTASEQPGGSKKQRASDTASAAGGRSVGSGSGSTSAAQQVIELD